MWVNKKGSSDVEFPKDGRNTKMKIRCVSCGHSISLDDAYDDFEGQVRCYVCNGLLQIKTEEGMIKGIRQASMETPPPARSQNIAPGAPKEKQV